jgi:predicted amidophosphoribosyltransferase
MEFETRTGKSEHGVCSFCGADKVLNKKSGKVFCSEKCWLKTSPDSPQSPVSRSNVPIDQFLTINQFNETLYKMRAAFKLQDERLKKLESLLANELGMCDELEIPIIK